MSADLFFDTNILVYAVAADDPRHTIARDLLAGGGKLSVQVLNEFANVARRKLKWSWLEVDRGVSAFCGLCAPIVPVTLSTHRAATALASRHRFAFYDCLIIASALEAGCHILVTEDMQDGRQVEGRLTIRNPFSVNSV